MGGYLTKDIDKYPFNEQELVWRGSGNNFKIGVDYKDVVVGVNLRQEIKNRWGEDPNTSKYQYIFGISLRREYTFSGAPIQVGQMLGFASRNNKSPAAASDKTNFQTRIGYSEFKAENGGLFYGGARFNKISGYLTAGAILSRSYSGFVPDQFNSQGTRRTEFALDGVSDPLYKDQTPEYYGYPYMCSDFGNCGGIRTVDDGQSGEICALDAEDFADETRYFWWSFGRPLEGFDGSGGFRDANAQAVFMGKGFSQPYDMILRDTYPAKNVVNGIGGIQGQPNKGVGVIIPGSYAGQARLDGSKNNYIENGGYDFDSISTFLFRVPLTGSDENVWFNDLNLELSGIPGVNLDYKYTKSYRFEKDFTREDQGYAFHQYSHYSSSSTLNETDDIRLTDMFEESPLWNDDKTFSRDTVGIDIGPVPTNVPVTRFSGVKGVGDITLYRPGTAHCFNVDVCGIGVNYNQLENCTVEENASECLSQNTPNKGALGWNGANDDTAYCDVMPNYPAFGDPPINDPICGCVNTLNDEAIQNFITLFEEETGIELPSYCFSDACTEPSSNAWIDPRNDFSANCPSDLTFCIALIEFTDADNNVIKDTEIYQDCSTQVGGGDKDGGSLVSSPITWIVIAVVVVVIIVVIFLMSRGKKPPAYPPPYPPPQ